MNLYYGRGGLNVKVYPAIFFQHSTLESENNESSAITYGRQNKQKLNPLFGQTPKA